ncbi:AAA family ATPase [Pseudarthrobacter sp. fls2-241-R2A-127]|uniref:AAA family ATPase n=1 Tax=Pseudarthrobacter sp. fls2-241-R2A-127 TaxID=3040303 RepID=UPI002555F88C|nr:AAA family ATPase [Pseudarthrobacter sp. fls2-241-R2A-127]
MGSPVWKAGTIGWGEYVDRLGNPVVTDEKTGVGLYVLGAVFKGNRRRRSDLVSRSAVTLDADTADLGLSDRVKALPWLAAYHTTFSHTSDSPRYRIVVPLSESVSPEEYIVLADALMDRLGRECFDRGSRDPERCMYWPSTPDADTYDWGVTDGRLLHPEELVPLSHEEQHPYDRFLSALGAAGKTVRGDYAQCPGHADDGPSLRFGWDECAERVWMEDFGAAKCSDKHILEVLNLPPWAQGWSAAHDFAVPLPDRAESTAGTRRLVLTSAADIRPRPVRWLWEGRLALGTLGLLAGREGLGKSTLAYWVAARITRGELPGVFEGEPKAVLVCATEDSWEHTIVPRLIAAEADLRRVYRVEVLNADEIHVGLRLPRDNHATETAAREVDAALLLLDPLISRLGDRDTHKDAEVRQALEPIVAVADRTRMAVLGLIHHNKSGSTDPLQLIMGSKAFTAVARSVHTVVPDPDDDTKTIRLFGTPKNNLGRSDLPALRFEIEGFSFLTDEGPAETGRLIWRGEAEGTIADAMKQEQDGSATGEAADWLEDFLKLWDGVAPSAEIKKAGSKAGHSADALKRAKSRRKIGHKSLGFPRVTFWHLPGADLSTVGADVPGRAPTAPTAPTGEK